MDNYEEFNHLILLIGTNPLPNFVVADYFLQTNPNIQTIWLIHSEENRLQSGTHEQARNLETLLRKRWLNKHKNLKFPFEKITLTDVAHGSTINREIENKMLKSWPVNHTFHLNYTGGTKAMTVHVFRRLMEMGGIKTERFSYLDANNFRLLVDDLGIAVEDLRKEVQIDFDDLIALHGFQKVKSQNNNIDKDSAVGAYKKFLDVLSFPSMDPREGKNFEQYIYLVLRDKFGYRLANEAILHNWVIKYPTWSTYFELDLIMLNGYHLTGISCTMAHRKDPCKQKGFEIILRTRQIGGDEARAILISRSNRNQTKILQDELVYDTGGSQENILTLGVDDLRKEENYLRKIEKFVFD